MSHFEIEDEDIVKLTGDAPDDPPDGWVNVGVFALLISVDHSGGVQVIAFARSNEDKELARFYVDKSVGVEAGGINDDEEGA